MSTSPVEELLCGGVGGALAVACTHPLDTLKTRMQAGLAADLGLVLRTEGISGLYRGVSLPILSQPLYIGGCFAGVALGRQLYDALIAPHAGGGGQDGGSLKRFLLAGSLGGVACATAVTPFEGLKVLMQSQSSQSTSAVALARQLLRRGGVPGLFTGLAATIAREIPGTVIWFGTFETASRFFEREWKVPRAVAVVGGGICAGTAFWLSTLPIDRIKVLQQASRAGAQQNAWALARRVMRTEGLRGFYVGLGPTLVRGLALDVVQFSVADALRRQLVTTRGVAKKGK